MKSAVKAEMRQRPKKLRGPMTVDELWEKLAKLDGKKRVVVYWEDEKSETHFFGIDEISLTRGTPKRLAHDKPGFGFAGKGPAEWVFIEVSPD
jgi:hypothetical protein